jgi:hypothetical protein
MNINAINGYSNYNKQNYMQQQLREQSPVETNNTGSLPTDTLSFKGKAKPSKNNVDKIGKFFSKYYSEKMYNNETLQKISEKLSKIDLKADMTVHMAALGSAITSGVYMSRTLKNKDLDPDKRRTLAINQAMCFVIPTIGAYTADHYLQNYIKKNEYKFSGMQSRAQALGKASAKDVERLSSRLKHFRPLASLAIFTLIYRYVTPVLVTPLANMVGDKLNEKIANKQKAGENQTVEPDKVGNDALKESKSLNDDEAVDKLTLKPYREDANSADSAEVA